MRLVVENFGENGVNVDKNPLELGTGDLTQAQNGISDPAAGRSSLRKRPGLIEFTVVAPAGDVLGGIDLPLQDLSASGTHWMYIGRGPTA